MLKKIDEPDLLGYKTTCVVFANGESNLVGITSENNLLIIYETKNFCEYEKLWLEVNITSFTFNYDNTKILAIDEQSRLISIVIKPIKIETVVYSFGDAALAACLKISPFFNNLAAVGASNGSVYIIEISLKNCKYEFKNAHSKGVTHLSFSTINQMLLVSISDDFRVNFYDILLSKQIKTLETTSRYYSIAFYADGKTIALGSKKGLIHIYDLSSCKEPKIVISVDSEATVQSLEFFKSDKGLLITKQQFEDSLKKPNLAVSKESKIVKKQFNEEIFEKSFEDDIYSLHESKINLKLNLEGKTRLIILLKKIRMIQLK